MYYYYNYCVHNYNKLKFIADSSCPHSEGGQRSVAGTEKKKKLHQRDNADIFFLIFY